MHMLAKVAGVMVCLVGFGIAGVSAQAKEFDQPAAITATLIPLNPDDPAQDRVGKLRYVTGYALTSDHYQFGGLSALLMNGSRIVSIADNSLWWQATFDPADTENPFKNSTLTWQRPRALNKDMKKAGDAESLVRAPFGYLIGFEYYHRIEHVWFPGGLAAVTDSSKQMNFTGIARNSGMEAMTWMGDKLLVFQEKGKDHKGLLRGWIVSGDKAEPLSVRLPENYGVTDATTLPGGDILLLLRRYSIFTGFYSKIVRVNAGSITPGSIVSGEEIATLKPPLNVDNMEGLDAVQMPDGTIRLYMISDDNYRASQRTLFMVFDLIDG